MIQRNEASRLACSPSRPEYIYLHLPLTFPAHKSHNFEFFMHTRNLVSLVAALLGVGAARIVLPLVGCANSVSLGSKISRQDIPGEFVQAIIAFWAELAP